MNISFSSKRLQKILTEERLLKKYYSNYYKNIKSRLTEIYAANSLNEIPNVPPPRRHKLTGDKNNMWGIDYSKNRRIVISPDGNYDINNLSTITSIVIETLEDYH